MSRVPVRLLCWGAALLALLGPASPSAQTQAASASPPAATTDRILPMEVTINGAKGGTWILVERGGILYAPRDAFAEWRVELKGDAGSIDFKGERYWPLSAVPGFKAKIDFATQSVQLLFSPSAFSALRLSRELATRPALSPVMTSAFVNYDLNYAASNTRGAATTHDVGLLTEVGLSNRWGVLTSSHVARRLSGAIADGSPSFLRLETTFTRDFVDTNRTLRVGDASTRPGLWGRNVYFGGVQIGTNFGLTPGFVSQPLPVLRGLSAAPSTVELYVNDVLRQVSNVPTGPFAIDNFPLMTGSGEARLVVRDLLGRETVIVQSFFANNQLLARGLNDWSLEAGAVREGLGTTRDEYGDRFASGTWRHGYNERLTLEGRAEATRRLRTLGFGATTALPRNFLATVAAIVSDHRAFGRGASWVVGLERDSVRNSFTLQAQGSSRDFRVLGQEEDFLPNKLQVAGNWTYFAQDASSFGVGFATISRYGEERVTTVSANYSTVLWERGSVNVAASRAIGGTGGSSVGVTFVLPLDERRSLSASMTSRSIGGSDFHLAANESPTRDSALGWRALAGRQQDQARVEGGLYYLGRRGTLSGEASASPDRQATRIGASGGMVLADGKVFATRRVDQAFAIAEVAGYPDIGVGIGSNVLTRTDADGVALIPNLWPYQTNSVRLDPKDLPVSAEIDSIEINTVPSWRSGVKVTFPVRSGRGALLRVVLDDGEAAPAGATVEVEGDKAQFYVARRGEAFVTGLQPKNRVLLNWKGHQCGFEVSLPPPNPDEVPRLGPFTCKGIAR
jgi:outer membrane usher protein